MIKKIFSCALLAFAVTGCANTSGLDAKTSQSTFDGAKTVRIAPHSLGCKSACSTMGFGWTSKSPNDVFVDLKMIQLPDYKSIQQLRFNIDGQISNFKPIQTLTDYKNEGVLGKTATQSFVIPQSYAKKLHNSKDVRVQIVTEAGSVDDYLIIGDKDSKAYHALGRFLTQLSQAK